MDSKWHGLCEGIATIGTGPKDVKETLNIKVFFFRKDMKKYNTWTKHGICNPF